jgi:hypothetical protein
MVTNRLPRVTKPVILFGASASIRGTLNPAGLSVATISLLLLSGCLAQSRPPLTAGGGYRTVDTHVEAAPESVDQLMDRVLWSPWQSCSQVDSVTIKNTCRAGVVVAATPFVAGLGMVALCQGGGCHFGN